MVRTAIGSPIFSRGFVFLSSLALLMSTACNSGVSSTGGGTGAGTNDGGNSLVDEPLSNEGSISGKLFDSQSTRTSTEDAAAAQALPPEFDTDDAMVSFKDLEGNDLLDGQGNPIADVPLNPDGTFEANGLPVGTDFTVCGDLGADGTCDIESCIQIPADETGTQGHLDGVRADPLTTIVLARFGELVEKHNLTVDNIPVSPAVVVARVVAAYTTLFEDSGIDQEITLDDVLNQSREQLIAFFNEQLPAAAQSGVDIAEGNIEVSRAPDPDGLVLAVAKTFLRAGFPVEDGPGGPDLSALADLEGIKVTSPSELFGNQPFEDFGPPPDEFLDGIVDGLPPDILEQFPEGVTDENIDEILALLPEDLNTDLLNEFDGTVPDEFVDDVFLAAAEAENEPVIYINTFAEPNRNFVNFDESESEGGIPQLPFIGDHIMLEMARLHIEGRRISVGALYEILTNMETGMGARLIFEVFDPNFHGPPLTVFETADGRGKAINLEKLFGRIFQEDLHTVDIDSPNDFVDRIRGILGEFIGDTVPPAFQRLFDGFASDRIEGIESLAKKIRDARSHLPFNASGPSTFFVVSDGDPFFSDTPVSPITVDADLTVDGFILSVRLNETGDGKFFLGFTQFTEETGLVELIVRETGTFVHGPGGPARVNLFDESTFEPVGGIPFGEFVSDTGLFYPGTHVTVVKDDFRPDFEVDGQVDVEFDAGPNEELFVLSTGIENDAQPVRVDFDFNTGLATFNPFGRHLLMFVEDSHETGLFALFNEETGRPASLNDPLDFFEGPTEIPEGFDEFFNEVEHFEDFGEFDNPDQFLDDVFHEFDMTGDLPPLPEDGLLPPDGEMPPPDGDMPPPDGDMPPPDGDMPPPDGDMPPPDDNPPPPTDGTVNPAEFDETFPETDMIPDGEFFDPGFILITPESIAGLDLGKLNFARVFGAEVPNGRYNADADPFFDDANGNGVHDPGELTAPFRPTLFDLSDWRATDIRFYYRRADNGQSVTFEEIDFESATPVTIDGVALVARNFLPRLNAFRFGRPNTAINLLTAFTPPNFLDGTHSLNRDTHVDIFTALGMINLIMDQVFNVEAEVDIDGIGPLPAQRMLIDAHMFVVPVGDPFVLLLKGFAEQSTVERPDKDETEQPETEVEVATNN